MYNVKLQRITAGTVFGLARDDIRFDDAVVTCDTCGKEGIQSDYFNLVISIGSLGHHSLCILKEQPPEMWACSLDCWAQLFVTAGKGLAEELVEINAEEEQSDHHTRARELREEFARDRVGSGESWLLAEPRGSGTTAKTTARGDTGSHAELPER